MLLALLLSDDHTKGCPRARLKGRHTAARQRVKAARQFLGWSPASPWVGRPRIVLPRQALSGTRLKNWREFRASDDVEKNGNGVTGKYVLNFLPV